jgi:phosphoribosylamine--glycine ligase
VLAPAQDFKRIHDEDQGPNTGGMGAYSPVPFVPPALVDKIVTGCIEPTLFELRRRGIDYRGVLYAGLMLTPDGPKMLEYNVRFGDPEAQVVLPRFASSLTELLHGAAAGCLPAAPSFVPDAAVTVVCAAANYPATPRSGDPIAGIDAANEVEGVTVFCAGVQRRDHELVTAGGRVLSVTALGPSITAARERAYRAVRRIAWTGMQFRSDIAARAAGE